MGRMDNTLTPFFTLTYVSELSSAQTRRFLCVRITPLLEPVVPLVKIREAISSSEGTEVLIRV